MKHPDLKTIKADVSPDFKKRVSDQAKKEGRPEADIIKRAVGNYLGVVLRK